MQIDTIHLLPAAWVGEGPYTQVVTLQNVTLTKYSKVDLQPTASVMTQLAKDGVRGLYAHNSNGTLTVYAVGAAPTAELELQAEITNAKTIVKSIDLSADWDGDGPYTQTVTINNYTPTARTKVDMQPTAEQIQQLIDDGVRALYISNDDGTLTAYSAGAAPTADMTIQVTVSKGSIPAEADATLNLSADWDGNGPYTQIVTIDGYTPTKKGKVDLQPTAEALAQLAKDGVHGLYIENDGGTLIAHAVGAAPTAAMTLPVLITDVPPAPDEPDEPDKPDEPDEPEEEEEEKELLPPGFENLYPEGWEQEEAQNPQDAGPIGYKPGVAFDYRLGDFVRDGRRRVIGSTGIDSWKSWVVNCLQTERYAHLAYNSDFGIEYRRVFAAESREEAESILARQITEALLADQYGRTAYVEDMTFTWPKADAVQVDATIVGIDDVTIDITAYMTTGGDA